MLHQSQKSPLAIHKGIFLSVEADPLRNIMSSSIQASESNNPEIFLLAHVPTLKEMIFTHDVHEILARKHLDDRAANEEVRNILLLFSALM